MVVLLSGAATLLSQSNRVIEIAADLTDAPRKILHGDLRIPVQPGPLTLLFPEWIPGEHAPTGPVDNLAGLFFHANGKELEWKRDDVNMYALHLTIPSGTAVLEAHVDFLATADPEGFSSGACTTPNLAVLNWNQVLLYPEGRPANEITFRPAVKIPEGWQLGTALEPDGEAAGVHRFRPVPLSTLVDSPVLSGRFFKEIALAPDVTPKHFLDIAGDGPEDLAITDQQINGFSNLVRETGALFKSRHYNSYHFLLTLSDSVAHFGLEHHQSSDDRADARTLIDEDFSEVNADLLPHEFTHSWNGKYRRPEGLVTATYQQPMKGNLLWVYEGLTQYLGDVLAARSGIWSAAQFKTYLAASAAEMDHRPGRLWRNLEDTAISAQILYAAPEAWQNWRRSTDFYPSGELLWLDVDATIRKLSNNTKSLNNFCAKFFGPPGDTGPLVRPYNFDELVKALNEVQVNDWSAFLNQRLYTHAPHGILGGITGSGYSIAYTPETNDYIRATNSSRGGVTAWYSLGFDTSSENTISDVLFDSLAFKAGLGPGMRIVAVNGRQANDEVLRAAIRNSKTEQNPIELIVSNTGWYRVIKLDYHDGERWPHLVHTEGQPDYLEDILRPLTSHDSLKAVTASR